jgi:hypothetical protein
MLASTSLRKESVERVITPTNGFVTWHLTIRLDTMLQTEQLPASIPNLDTGLAKMKAKSFTHFCCSSGFFDFKLEEWRAKASNKVHRAMG